MIDGIWCDVPEGENLNDWLNENVSVITTPNYRSWLRGCPRKSEEEIAALEEAHKRVEAARQALMKEIEQQKGE